MANKQLHHSIYVTPSELKHAKGGHRTGFPYSKIYEYTYGYSMNYYQPMIDYLDRRDAGDSSQSLPHLPWANERYIQEYYPGNHIDSYDTKKVNVMANKYQNAAFKTINNFEVKKHYYGSLVAPRMTKLKRTLPKSYSLREMETRDIGKLREEVDDFEKAAYFKIKEVRKMREKEAQGEVDEEYSQRMKCALRGKSAKHICNILMGDVSSRN